MAPFHPRFRPTRRQLLAAGFGTFAVRGAAARGASITAQPAPPAERTDFSKGMHLVITGTGAALPVPDRGNAGAAVVVDGTTLLFDCGRRTTDNLLLAGINPIKVEYILFTHLHFDHMGEFGYYLISSWIGGRQTPFKVFGPDGTMLMVKGALECHHTDVAFITKRVQGLAGPPMKSSPLPPVEARDIAAGLVLETKDFKLTAGGIL